MSEKQKYFDFEAYERVVEPHKRERVSAWRTAIGLQDVDGLRVSDYLKNDICGLGIRMTRTTPIQVPIQVQMIYNLHQIM